MIAAALNAPLEQIAGVELAADVGRRQAAVPELKACRFGDDQQIRETAESGDDVLGDPVPKENTLSYAGSRKQMSPRTRGKDQPPDAMALRVSPSPSIPWLLMKRACPMPIILDGRRNADRSMPRYSGTEPGLGR
jgi:hypothetical protein